MKPPRFISALLLTATAAVAEEPFQRLRNVAGEVGQAAGGVEEIVSGVVNLPGVNKDMTRVRIEGMKSRSEREVLEMMGGRLTHVRSSPPSAPLADDAAFLLRQILRKDGYADAGVDWKIAKGNEIVLIVREGFRLSLGQVTVTGVPADDTKKLAKLYAKPAEKERPLMGGTPPFREGDVETGLSFIRQEYNAHGYWLADVSITSRTINPSNGMVDLTIDVKPGVLHKIASPRVTDGDGVGKFSSSTAQPFVGKSATTKNLNAMRLAVEEAATSQGYPDADIRMGRTLEAGRFIPEFSITLGTRVRLRDIHIAGLKRTNPDRIAARLDEMEGDWYDEAAMNKKLRTLFATGAFASARIETEPVGEGTIDATLHFEESRAKEISLAAGFGSYQGFIMRATYADRNLFGNLWGFNAGIEASSRGLLGEARITDPWLFGSDVSGTARVYALMYGREGYDTYETGFDGKLIWKFGDHYTLDLLAGSSAVKLTGDGLPSSELGEKVYINPKIRLTQTVDFRDNPVLPTKGWHLENPLEIGSAVGDMSTSYVKAGLTGGWFHEINRHYQVGIGGEWGVLMPGGDGEDLPIDLRLFNGGARSVRSFPERELGPLVDGYPTGGEAMWNTNMELIREITGAVKAVAFFDAGKLARNHEDISNSDVELATGLGVRLDLPIGPVRLEYGYNLTRDEGEPAGTFHFAIGYAY
jgi:outer membrane protein assembly complex protein YaeT